MSIRHGLLAILAEHPAHGYGLKSRFERSTASTWPLNVGQVYTTLARLERDGLVEPDGVDDHARQSWRITDEGRRVLAEWYDSPVDDAPARDELAIKVLLAVAADGVDAREILQRQRHATMERLHRYARHKRDVSDDSELAWVLLLDALSLRAEAELKWLDLCERRIEERGA